MRRMSVKEVLEIAVNIERNGAEFYDALLDSSQSQEAATIFTYLAGQERQHIIGFQRLAAGVEASGQSASPDAEHQDYLEALVEAHLLTSEGSGARLARRASDHAEATRAAIQFEKDSILLFEALRDSVAEPDVSVVDAVIAEERMHLLDLYHFSVTHKPSADDSAARKGAGST